MASVRKRTWKTSSGEVRTAWRVDFVDANGARGQRQLSTKREADAFRVDVEARLRSGTFRPDAAKVTIGEVCEAYLTYAEGRMKRGERFTRRHLEAVSGLIANHILHPMNGIGGLKLAQITARRVGEFRDRLRSGGLSVPTTRKVIGRLKVILDFAIGRDLVASNAAAGVRVIGRRDEGPKQITPPSKESLARLMAVADGDFRMMLAFACATGVRASELYALRWHHIDMDSGNVTIETRVDAYREEDAPKTKAGNRAIPLGRPIVRMLREWKIRSRFKRGDDLVFPNSRGGYLNHYNLINRRYDPLFAKLDELHKLAPESHPPAPARFNWHALRHFAVSTWIEQGFSPKAVQTFAGHSSLQVTMDRYGHLFPSEDHGRLMDKIAEELFAPALTPKGT